MGWAIMFLVLIALVIILSISLINWKIQIYKVIVQLNAILNRKTKKLVTVSLSDRRLEHLVEIINQIVSKDNIYLGEIQKKENELKENISCLSHDLRTPLTSIRGYLQLLSSAPDEKRAEYISALSGKALRLERLIDDFYQISLLEAGQYPFYYEKVELCSLLTEILLDNYSIFSVNGIEPQIEIPNMDIYLNADRKACIRIIQNLIFNAVTSTTNNVVIQLINIADSVQLCIKNPVASIPTEEYSKLLERFYVADVSRSNGTSGQGLYIVKKLLLMMNCTNPIIEIHDHRYTVQIIKQTAALRAAVCSCFQKYGIFRAERSWQIFEIIDRLFALPINLFTILRIMPLINSHPLDLFRVSACRLDDNGGFLAYAPSPLLDIFAIFATINLGGLLCVSRMK